MQGQYDCDVVVLGSGPADCTAALYATRASGAEYFGATLIVSAIGHLPNTSLFWDRHRDA